MVLGNANSKGVTTGVIDIANYDNDTEVKASAYEYESTNTSGSKSTESGVEKAKMEDFNNIHIDNLFNGCEDILKETGIGITLDDFGFVSFK